MASSSPQPREGSWSSHSCAGTRVPPAKALPRLGLPQPRPSCPSVSITCLFSYPARALRTQKAGLRILEHPELEGNRKDHRVQLLTPHRTTQKKIKKKIKPTAESGAPTVLELHQAWCHEHIPGEPVAVPSRPLGEEPFPNTQPETLDLAEGKAVAPGEDHHSWEHSWDPQLAAPSAALSWTLCCSVGTALFQTTEGLKQGRDRIFHENSSR